jgi:EAL domain-containing protein (putative c-di-GMP-specific phosphodiesterase class I)
VLEDSPCPVVVEYSGELGTDPSDWAALLPPTARLAVDDAGAGYDSLALVEKLRPRYMKLDRTTVTGIEIDAARQAFVGTLVSFAEQHDCDVIAEGIESEAEREALREAGVRYGQGYLIGRPVPIERIAGAARGADELAR